MGRIYQTSKKLLRAINKEGCYFRTMLSIAERFTDKLLTADEILEIYYDLIDKGFMKQNCYLENPEKAANAAFKVLKQDNLRCIQIGKKIEGKDPVYWGWVKDKTVSAIALNGITAKGNGHWVEADWSGHELWNPYPGAYLVTLKKQIFYRIIGV